MEDTSGVPVIAALFRACRPQSISDGRSALQYLLEFNTVAEVRELLDNQVLTSEDWLKCVNVLDNAKTQNTLSRYYEDLHQGTLEGDWERAYAGRLLLTVFSLAAALSMDERATTEELSYAALQALSPIENPRAGCSQQGNGPIDIVDSCIRNAYDRTNSGLLYELACLLSGRERPLEGCIRLPVCVVGPRNSAVPTWLRLDVLANGCGRIFPDPRSHFRTQFSQDFIDGLNATSKAIGKILSEDSSSPDYDYRYSVSLPGDQVISGTSMSGAFAAGLIVHRDMKRNLPNSLLVLAECNETGSLDPVDSLAVKLRAVQRWLQEGYSGRVVVVVPPGKFSTAQAELSLATRFDGPGPSNSDKLSAGHPTPRVSWQLSCISNLAGLREFLSEAGAQQANRIRIEVASANSNARPSLMQQALERLNAPGAPAFQTPKRLMPLARLPAEPKIVADRKQFRDCQQIIASPHGGPVRLLLHGPGGTGKTHLLLRLAHRIQNITVAEGRPSGMYVDLRGYSKPITTEECLRKLLFTLNEGADIELPDTLDELYELYCQQLPHDGTTVYLDNVKDFAQIEKLIPPGNCGCIVSARENLRLDRFKVVKISAMTHGEACDVASETISWVLNEKQLDDTDGVPNDIEVRGICERIATATQGHALQVRTMAGGFAAKCLNRPDWDHLLRELEDEARRKHDDILLVMYNQLGDLKAPARRLSAFPRDFDDSAADSILGDTSGNVLDELVYRNVISKVSNSPQDKQVPQNGQVSRRFRYVVHDELRSFLLQRLDEHGENDSCMEALMRHFTKLNELSIPPEHQLVDDGKAYLFSQESTNILAVRDWLLDKRSMNGQVNQVLSFGRTWYSTLATKSEDSQRTAEFLLKAADWASELGDDGRLQFDILCACAGIYKSKGDRKESATILESALKVAIDNRNDALTSQAMFDLVFLVVDWDADKAARYALERTLQATKHRNIDTISLALGLLGFVADEGRKQPLEGLKYYRTALRLSEQHSNNGKSLFTSSNRLASISHRLGYYVGAEHYFRGAFLTQYCQEDSDWTKQSLEDWLDAQRNAACYRTEDNVNDHVDGMVDSLCQNDELSKALDILISAVALHFTCGSSADGWKYLKLARTVTKHDISLRARVRDSARRILRKVSDSAEYEKLLEELIMWHTSDVETDEPSTEESSQTISVKSELADLYDDGGIRFERESDFERAEEYYWKSLRTADEADDPRLIRVAWERLIRVNNARERSDAACSSARNILRELNGETRFDEVDRMQLLTAGKAFLGRILRIALDPAEAWSCFREAYHRAKEMESEELINLVLSCICDLGSIRDPVAKQHEVETAAAFLLAESQHDALLRLYAIQLKESQHAQRMEDVATYCDELVLHATERIPADADELTLAIAAYGLLSVSGPSKAISELSKLEQSFGRLGNATLSCRTRLVTAIALHQSGNIVEALGVLQKASESSSSLPDELGFEILTWVAHSFRQLGEFAKCEEIHQHLCELSRQKDNDNFLLIGQANLALVEITQGRYSNAHRLLISNREGCLDDRIKAHLLATESQLLREAGQTKEALLIATAALTLADEVGDDECLLSSLLHVLSCRRDLRDWADVQIVLERVRNLVPRMPDIHIRLDVLEAEIECGLAQGQLEHSEKTFVQFIGVAEQTESVIVRLKALLLKGKLLTARGNQKDALTVLQKAREGCTTINAVHIEHQAVHEMLRLPEFPEFDSELRSELETRRNTLRYEFETIDAQLIETIEEQMLQGDSPRGVVSRLFGFASTYVSKSMRFMQGLRRLNEIKPITEDVPADGSIGKVFHEMAKHFDSSRAGKMSATYQFDISEEGVWAFAIDNGECELIDGGVPNPSVEISLPATAWLAIREGKLNSQQAFMEGKLKIRGDMNLAMKLQQLFPIA